MIFKWIFRALVASGLFALFGVFTDAIHNPVVTFFTLGFYVKAKFVDWGLAAVGWILCIIIEFAIIYYTILFFAFVFNKSKKLIKKFKNRG